MPSITTTTIHSEFLLIDGTSIEFQLQYRRNHHHLHNNVCGELISRFRLRFITILFPLNNGPTPSFPMSVVRRDIGSSKGDGQDSYIHLCANEFLLPLSAVPRTVIIVCPLSWESPCLIMSSNCNL